MKVSVDISYYPLKEAYREPIKAFISRLQQHPELEISVNSMSTSLFGDYEVIMSLLNRELYSSLQDIPKSVFVIKLSGGCH